MLIEVPDPQIIGGVIAAFLVGLFGLLIYNKMRSFVTQKADPSYFSRMEYYERQLIDMKIRLDALDLKEPISAVVSIEEPPSEARRPPPQNEASEIKKEAERPVPKPRMPNMDFNGIAEHVLGLITTGEMTSRDIQITIGRSREHTSRLMKRLFEEGLVERNIKKKPFTYKITEKGLAVVGQAEQPITVS
jgi:predicted transcriptional regulator